MSTIAVAKKGNEICIASETLTTFGTTKMNESFIEDHTKIIRWGDSLVGIVGAVAISMILRDIAKKDKDNADFSSVESIYKYFIKLHKYMKKKYFLQTDEDDEDPVESSQLEIVIANSHGLFGVHSLREVYSFQKFWAYGSGGKFALGAMNSVYDLEDFDAEKIAKAGVNAGITFDDASGGTILFHKIQLLAKE